MREQTAMYEGTNWRKLCLRLLQQIWIIIGAGVAGAVIGSSLYLLIEVVLSGPAKYEITGGFYIAFAEGVMDADDYYNAFTWNSVIHQDQIMDVTMQKLASKGRTSITRAEVESMTRADILSDVRYLTLTVTGTDAVVNQDIFDAMSIAISAFGQNMPEFDDISQTHCYDATLVVVPDFTWRAGVLGCTICMVGVLLILLFLYTVDDSVYVPEDVESRFSYPVLGITFAANKKSNKFQKMLDTFEKELQCNRQLVDEKYSNVVEVIVGDIDDLTSDIISTIKSEQSVILMIPYGANNGTILTKYVQNLKQRDIKITGVIITNADAHFIKGYYQTKSLRRKKA